MMMKTKSIRALAALLPILVVVSASYARVPVGTAFTYQGQLKQGGNLVNGTADFDFRLWDAEVGGSFLGAVQHAPNVSMTDGRFTVTLDFGPSAGSPNARWLEIQVRMPAGGGGLFTTLTPRQQLTPTPVALYALNAQGLTLPYQAVNEPDVFPFQITANTVDASALRGVAPTGTGVEGNGKIGVRGSGSQYGMHGILQQVTNGSGVFGEVIASGFPGNSTYGVFGRNPTAGGKGVFGYATNPNSFNIGVFGQADGTDGYGVFGYAGHATGQTYGGYFEVESTAGTGMKAWANAATGATNGVYGISLSSSGTGVRGSASAGTGNTVGVHGESFSTTGYGVAGYVAAPTGLQFGVAGAGVYGQSDTPGGSRGVYGRVTATTGQNFAVFGEALNSNNWAGYFTGKCHISDSLALGVTAPSFQLHLSQNSAGKPTSNVWTITSDARLKKNIMPISGALEQLLQLHGVTYQWIHPEDQGNMTGTYTGMIAQDVEKVFPEWISTGPDGYKRLTVIGFEGIVVEALRAMRAEKDAQIERLNAENADVRARLETLEAMMQELLAQQLKGTR